MRRLDEFEISDLRYIAVCVFWMRLRLRDVTVPVESLVGRVF